MYPNVFYMYLTKRMRSPSAPCAHGGDTLCSAPHRTRYAGTEGLEAPRQPRKPRGNPSPVVNIYNPDSSSHPTHITERHAVGRPSSNWHTDRGKGSGRRGTGIDGHPFSCGLSFQPRGNSVMLDNCRGPSSGAASLARQSLTWIHIHTYA